MKSYLQGIITGGALVFAMFVFMGQTDSEKLYKDIEKNINSSLNSFLNQWYNDNPKKQF